MADTGAPWNLPYPLSTDLVRDGAGDIQDLAEAVATGLSAAGNAGIGSNVVQTVKTDTFSASLAANADTAVTGLAVTITPTTATSKVLVLVEMTGGSTSDVGYGFNMLLFRGATAISIGDVSSTRPRLTAGSRQAGDTAHSHITAQVLDSPGTASPVTYSVNVQNGVAITRTLYVNRSNNFEVITASRITAIEVAV